jgi:hypothetical protein
MMEYSELLHNEIEFYAHKDDAFYMPSDKALALLNEIRRLQSVEKAQEWIPVSERLPDKKVLWLDIKSGEQMTGTFNRMRDNDVIVCVYHGSDTIYFQSNFTHWQPLPPLPTGETNE